MPKATALPTKVMVEIKSLPSEWVGDEDAQGIYWPATLAANPTSAGVPVYVVVGEPANHAVDRFKANLRKFLGL